MPNTQVTKGHSFGARAATRAGRVSAVQPALATPGQAVLEKQGGGCVHDVHARVQRSGKAHNDTHAQHKSGVAAVDAELVAACQAQHLLQDLHRQRGAGLCRGRPWNIVLGEGYLCMH